MKQKGFISIGAIAAIAALFLLAGGATIYFQSRHSPQTNNLIGTNCSPSLRSCGSGCIPQNAVCCDETGGNSYCLAPNTLCKANPDSNGEKERFLCSEDGTQKSNDCSIGQISCGMQCIKAGERCCLGGACNGNETNSVAKGKVEEVKYGGEITMSASYYMSYNMANGRTGHLSQQFSATIHFSDLAMSFTNAFDFNTTPIARIGRTKITGTYTVSCSDTLRNESDSTTGEITVSDYPESGMIFHEMFDQTVKPAKHLGLKPQLSFYTTTIEPFRSTWCSLASSGSYFLNSIIYDVFTGNNGSKNIGNTQRLASMELKKTGYMSYDGETIPFSGTIVTGLDDDGNPVGEVIPYSGTFKAYRQ